MKLLQIPSEFDPVVAIYKKAKPKRVLEIGCWEGGSLKVWLEGAPDICVAVDPEHRNPDAYHEWTKPGTILHVLDGKSQDPDIIASIQKHAPYDWVFIDGDHDEGAVRSDVDVCLPLVSPGGYLLLHDITPPFGMASYPPGVVLQELWAEDYDVAMFVEENEDPWAHGIGLVHL